MTEETAPVIDEGEGATPEYSPDEQKAVERGWVPEEQWEGDATEWVGAREFNRRGELFGKINSQSRKLNEMQTAMKRMHEMMVNNSETAYKQALQDLASQREQALQEGDTEQVRQIEGKAKQVLGGMEKSKQEIAEKYAIPETPQFFDEWMDNNPWYNQDEDKTAFANSVAQQFIQKSQAKGVEPDRQALLNEISTKVNKVFGGKSMSNNTVPSVLGASGHTRTGTASPRGKGIAALRDDEQQIARTIMQSTGMSEKDYMKSYNEINKR